MSGIGKPPTALGAAYRTTRYEVDATDGGFVLRVGERCGALGRVYSAYGVKCAAFVTAWNPGSRMCATQDNERAHRKLIACVDRDGLAWLPGTSVDPGDEWPAETSVLVLGADEPAALELGRRFGQNAVVCAGEDLVPRLLWTHEQ